MRRVAEAVTQEPVPRPAQELIRQALGCALPLEVSRDAPAVAWAKAFRESGCATIWRVAALVARFLGMPSQPIVPKIRDSARSPERARSPSARVPPPQGPPARVSPAQARRELPMLDECPLYFAGKIRGVPPRTRFQKPATPHPQRRLRSSNSCGIPSQVKRIRFDLRFATPAVKISSRWRSHPSFGLDLSLSLPRPCWRPWQE